MRRFWSILASILAAATLAACGAGSETGTTQQTGHAAAQSPSQPTTVQPAPTTVPQPAVVAPAVSGKGNVIVVLPGMFGSVGEELFYGNRAVIGTVERALAELVDNGSRVVKSSDIPAMLTIDPILGRYDELVRVLRAAGRDVVPLPYDWRLTPDKLVDYIHNAIGDIAVQYQGRRISVVAHSYGGLVMRACIQQGKCPQVDNVVFLGTPHHGVADAYYLRGGEPYGETRADRLVLETLLSAMKNAYGIIGHDAIYVRDAWPSVVTLLPTWDYIQVWDRGSDAFVPQREYCLRNDWLTALNTVDKAPWYRDMRFLNVIGTVGTAIQTIGVHDEGILGCSQARWNPNGRPISAMELKLASVPGLTTPSWRAQFVPGDGLVTIASATFPFPGNVEPVLYPVSHSGMLSDQAVLARVVAFLNATDAR